MSTQGARSILAAVLFLPSLLFGSPSRKAGPLELGKVEGLPGEEARVPVLATHTEPIVLVFGLFEFDSSRLEYLGFDVAGSDAAGANPQAIGGRAHGSGAGSFGIFDSGEPLDGMFHIVPGSAHPIGFLRFRIRADAPPGDATVRPVASLPDLAGTTGFGFHEPKPGEGLWSAEPDRLESGRVRVKTPSGPRPVGELACEQFLDRARLTFSLTEPYDAIRVERGGQTVARLAGDATSYEEPLLATGLLGYAVLAESAGKASVRTRCELVAVTPAAPPIAELSCHDGVLSWSSPVLYDRIKIVRERTAVAELAGDATSWTDPDWALIRSLTLYRVVGELGGFSSPEVQCLDNGIWISEAGDVEVTPEATHLVVPLFVTSTARVRGVDFCLEIDEEQFEFVDNRLHQLEGVDPPYEPEFLAVGARGACGHPAAGVVWDYSPPRQPEKDLAVGLRQRVLNFVFRPRRPLVAGTSHAVRLVSSSLAVDGVAVSPDVLLSGRIYVRDPAAGGVQRLRFRTGKSRGSGAGAALPARPGGATVELEWENGATYEAVRVERNGVEIAELSGSATAFTDREAPLGIFTYKVLGVREGRETFPASALVVTLDLEGAFQRGDANGDGRVDVSDAVFTLNFLFTGGPPPRCEDAADADDDGRLILTDAVATLRFLFWEESAIPAPGPYQAWFDPTADALGCGR